MLGEITFTMEVLEGTLGVNKGKKKLYNHVEITPLLFSQVIWFSWWGFFFLVFFFFFLVGLILWTSSITLGFLIVLKVESHFLDSFQTRKILSF